MNKKLAAQIRDAQPFYYKRGKVGILMIHGFTSTPYVFREVAEQLADLGYTVSSPLIAGHGTSPEDLETTTWKDWCVSMEKAYDELAKDCDEIVVIGASFGGNIACWVAARRKIKGLILIGIPRWLQKHRLTILYATLLSTCRIRYFNKQIAKSVESDMLFAGPTHSYIRIPMKSVKECFYLMTVVTEKQLRKITVPTLIIQSTHDGLVRPASGKFVFSRIRSKNKNLIWINEAHHQLHNGNYRTLIYSLISEFMLGWMKQADRDAVVKIDT